MAEINEQNDEIFAELLVPKVDFSMQSKEITLLKKCYKKKTVISL